MPLFDFRCEQCQSVSELLIMGQDKAVCPKCGSENLQRLVGAPAAPGKSKQFLANARTAAAAQGHFSNYSPSELPRR